MSRRGPRFGITQRRVEAMPTGGARDSLDAAWSAWFAQALPAACMVAIPNFTPPQRAVAWCKSLALDALVLSGGDDLGTTPVRDATEEALLTFACEEGLPVLGTCRGMQMLHRFTGGALVSVSGHVGTPHPIRIGDAVQEVNSWHSWAVIDPSAHWNILATSDDGCIEAIRHVHLPWLGVMWHPERLQGESFLVQDWLARIPIGNSP